MELIDLFFPQNVKCLFCGVECNNNSICEECLKVLPFIKGKTCIKCGGKIIGDGDICIECKEHPNDLLRVYSVFEYIDDVRDKILKFKNGKKYIGRAFSQLMLDKFNETDIPFDYIIPMPIHDNRRKQRGFNQCEILCSDILREYGRVDNNIVHRIKDTPHQTGLSRENRLVNTDKAFKVLDKSKVKNKIILIVDDIYTTGSTLNECANALYKAGAKSVYGLCLARAPISNILD